MSLTALNVALKGYCSLVNDALHWKEVDVNDSGCSNAKKITIKARRNLDSDSRPSATGTL
jgi:hypothetical protein